MSEEILYTLTPDTIARICAEVGCSVSLGHIFSDPGIHRGNGRFWRFEIWA